MVEIPRFKNIHWFFYHANICKIKKNVFFNLSTELAQNASNGGHLKPCEFRISYSKSDGAKVKSQNLFQISCAQPFFLNSLNEQISKSVCTEKGHMSIEKYLLIGSFSINRSSEHSAESLVECACTLIIGLGQQCSLS